MEYLEIILKALVKILAEVGFKQLIDRLISAKPLVWLSENQILNFGRLLALSLVILGFFLGAASDWQRVYNPEMSVASFGRHIKETNTALVVVGCMSYMYNRFMNYFIVS
jgi:hypothetical protein